MPSTHGKAMHVFPFALTGRQCVSREEFELTRAEIESLKEELNSWQNTTISILKTYLIDQGDIPKTDLCNSNSSSQCMWLSLYICTGVGQCSCTTDIKQLWEKMDRVQDSVAGNNIKGN